MSWQLAKCPASSGNLALQFQTGAHTDWTSFWVRNPRLPLATVEPVDLIAVGLTPTAELPPTLADLPALPEDQPLRASLRMALRRPSGALAEGGGGALAEGGGAGSFSRMTRMRSSARATRSCFLRASGFSRMKR